MWTSSSSSSSSSRSTSPYTTNPKTMEEVWKDITLASDLPPHNPSTRGVILQDFFSKDPPPNAASASPAPPPPLPPTMLTLSSAPDHLRPISHHVSSLNNVSLDPNENGVAGKKRFQDYEKSSSERRHKRMIKNRESAARSRARKQAYTNELELEVAHLLEENSKLKEQQQQLCRAAAAQYQKRKALHRTSTAPF